MEKQFFTDQILSLNDQFYRIAKSIIPNEEFCKDIMQDFYFKMWNMKARLKTVHNIPAFSMKILRNLCLDFIRQKKVIEELPPELTFEELTPDDRMDEKKMAIIIRNAINHLPELQRTVIRLRDIEELEIKEIAFIVSSSENAVSANLSRARQKIRDYLIFNYDVK